MKTIGLLGGMSWQSTTSYYQAINRGVQQYLGGLHSAKVCLVSVDFANIEVLQRQNEWQKAGALLAKTAKQIEAGGADCLLICTNTMHKVAPQIARSINIPLLHIADCTGQKLQQEQIQTVGLLGTEFTMSEDFYKDKLINNFGIDVLVPSAAQQEDIHSVIYDELCLGKVNHTSKQRYLEVINSLHQRGAQGVILGCTEISLLVQQTDTDIPLFDTTAIHAQAAVDFAIAN